VQCISTPRGSLLEGYNIQEINSVNKVVLTYINALVLFICKIVTLAHCYEEDKVKSVLLHTLDLTKKFVLFIHYNFVSGCG
jgi:hypothetical protein